LTLDTTSGIFKLMPRRAIPLVTDHYYHIYNRSVGKIPIFNLKRSCIRAVKLINYYHFTETDIPFSKFNRLNQQVQEESLAKLLKKNDTYVDVVAFSLMPNHFHFLLKQKKNNGIVTFIANFQNSYAKFFNTINKRTGALFQNSFKSVYIENDAQLLHVSRYIHLNPYSSFLIKNIEKILVYPWSSMPLYFSKKIGFIKPGIVLGQFSKPADYKKFVLNQADYQRSLDLIKHLVKE